MPHTPGPWNWSTNIGLAAARPESIHGPKGAIVLSWALESNGRGQENTVISVSRDDGRLLLAAPELLETCRRVISDVDSDVGNAISGDTATVVRKAIAKATGA